MSSALLLPLIFLLGAASVGALLLVAFYPQIAAGSAFRRRVELIAAVGRPTAPQSHGIRGKPPQAFGGSNPARGRREADIKGEEAHQTNPHGPDTASQPQLEPEDVLVW